MKLLGGTKSKYENSEILPRLEGTEVVLVH